MKTLKVKSELAIWLECDFCDNIIGSKWDDYIFTGAKSYLKKKAKYRVTKVYLNF